MQEGTDARRQVDKHIIRQTDKNTENARNQKITIQLYNNTTTTIQWLKKARAQ